MLITLDTTSSIPIYVQLRNQIVTGIGRGELKAGEHLPTVRQLAADAGVNTMTVNKTYQLLKAEGFIEIDRRQGATVCPSRQEAEVYRGKTGKGTGASFGGSLPERHGPGRIFRAVRRYLRTDAAGG